MPANCGTPRIRGLSKAKVNRKNRTATFNFSAAGAAGFGCQLTSPRQGHQKPPKARFLRCTSPKTYRHLTAGKYIFRVRAMDAGGTGPTATRRFKINS